MDKVQFPIIRNVAEGGHHFERVLNENDKVKCFFCKSPILIDYRTVHMAPDGMEMVDCSVCKRHVSVLYYFDQVDQRINTPIKLKFHRGQRMRSGGLK